MSGWLEIGSEYERRSQVFDDFICDHIRFGQIGGILHRHTPQPENIEIDLVTDLLPLFIHHKSLTSHGLSYSKVLTDDTDCLSSTVFRADFSPQGCGALTHNRVSDGLMDG